MRPHRRTHLSRLPLALFALFAFTYVAAAQAPQPVCSPGPAPSKNDPVSPGSTSGIRIIVKGPDGELLQRKRFYLLARDVTKDSNFKPQTAPTRAAFLKEAEQAGAHADLIKWLEQNDCDSLYCPEYMSLYRKAIDDKVPGFKEAYEAGLKKYNNNDRLAKDWVTVNFPLKGLRTDYYYRKKKWLEEAARMGGEKMSAMTDEKGVAYFVGISPGTYYVSNLIPLEKDGVLWSCKVEVPPPLGRQLHSATINLTAPKTAPK